MKISKAFDNYIVHIEAAGKSKSYIGQVKMVCRLMIAEFGDVNISTLTEKDIKKWFNKIKKGKKESTHYLRVNVTRQVLKYLKKSKIKCVDYSNIELPSNHHSERIPLTKEEVQAVIDAADNVRAKFIISFLYASGVRVSELKALNRNQIENGTFRILGEKGHIYHYCHIDKRTEDLMEQYLATREDDWECLLATSIGRMSVAQIQKIVSRAGEKAKEIDKTGTLAKKFQSKHITPHILRHSFATNFIENEGSIYTLKQELGHKSVQSTAVYIHLSPKHAHQQYQAHHTF